MHVQRVLVLGVLEEEAGRGEKVELRVGVSLEDGGVGGGSGLGQCGADEEGEDWVWNGSG